MSRKVLNEIKLIGFLCIIASMQIVLYEWIMNMDFYNEELLKLQRDVRHMRMNLSEKDKVIFDQSLIFLKDYVFPAAISVVVWIFSFLIKIKLRREFNIRRTGFLLMVFGIIVLGTIKKIDLAF